MVVQRITVRYKVGKAQAAVSLLKEEFKRAQEQDQSAIAIRFYTSRQISDTTVGHFEFDSTSAMEQFWAHWEATSEAAEFGKKYFPLTEAGMITDILDVA